MHFPWLMVSLPSPTSGLAIVQQNRIQAIHK
jgi:hypothetical protein